MAEFCNLLRMNIKTNWLVHVYSEKIPVNANCFGKYLENAVLNLHCYYVGGTIDIKILFQRESAREDCIETGE